MSMVTTLLGRLNTTTRLPDQVPLPQPKLNGNGGNGAHHHRRRPQFRGGDRLAAMRAFAGRAFAGSKFVLDCRVSIADASRWTGSNPAYVAALLEVIATNDTVLLEAVLRGHVPVLLAGGSTGCSRRIRRRRLRRRPRSASSSAKRSCSTS